MAREATEERIRKFLLERGEQGATAAEIAAAFLGVGQVPEAMARRVVDPLLSGDARFNQGEDGRWRAAPAPAAGETTYTVVEFCFAPGPGIEKVPIECAVVRCSAARTEATRSTAIAPTPSLAPAARLPAGLTADELGKAPPLVKVLGRLAAFAQGTTLASFERTPFHARAGRSESGRDLDYLCIKQLARRLGLVGREASLRDGAAALGVACAEEPRAADLAAASVQMLQHLLGRLQEQGVRGRGELEDFLHPPSVELDFSRYDFDQAFLETLPDGPGVYVMKDANGLPVYVGKAANLRQRVTSYFRRTVRLDERVERIRDRITSLTVESVGSELEALLLEHQFIRDLAPELNVAAEVHERPGQTEGAANLILILPSRAAGHVELFMIQRGERLARARVARDEPEAAREAIREAFFAPAPAEADEADTEELGLAWSWLRRNRDRSDLLDVDAAAGLEAVMRLLADHFADTESSDRRTFRV